MAEQNYHIRFLFALCCCVLFSKKRIRLYARGCNVDSMDSMNSTGSAKPKRNEYIDPRDYWIDPSRNIRRLGDKDGEEVAVIRATPSCSATPNGTDFTQPSSRASTPRRPETNGRLATALRGNKGRNRWGTSLCSSTKPWNRSGAFR
jgi:hypothetical protein